MLVMTEPNQFGARLGYDTDLMEPRDLNHTYAPNTIDVTEIVQPIIDKSREYIQIGSKLFDRAVQVLEAVENDAIREPLETLVGKRCKNCGRRNYLLMVGRAYSHNTTETERRTIQDILGFELVPVTIN